MQLGIMQFITNKLYDMSNNRWSVVYSGDKSGYFFRALEVDTNTPKIHDKIFKETNACADDLAMFQKYPKQHNEKYLKSKTFSNFFCIEE